MYIGRVIGISLDTHGTCGCLDFASRKSLDRLETFLNKNDDGNEYEVF